MLHVEHDHEAELRNVARQVADLLPAPGKRPGLGLSQLAGIGVSLSQRICLPHLCDCFTSSETFLQKVLATMLVGEKVGRVLNIEELAAEQTTFLTFSRSSPLTNEEMKRDAWAKAIQSHLEPLAADEPPAPATARELRRLAGDTSQPAVDEVQPALPSIDAAMVEQIANAADALVQIAAKGSTIEETAEITAPAPKRTGRRWVQSDVDAEIRKYKADRQHQYRALCGAAGKPGAEKDAVKAFGRNLLAKKIGCSKALVGRSEVWISMADELGMTRGKRAKGTARTAKVGKIGLASAVEEQSAASRNPVLDEVERRELEERCRNATDAEKERLADELLGRS